MFHYLPIDLNQRFPVSYFNVCWPLASNFNTPHCRLWMFSCFSSDWFRDYCPFVSNIYYHYALYNFHTFNVLSSVPFSWFFVYFTCIFTKTINKSVLIRLSFFHTSWLFEGLVPTYESVTWVFIEHGPEHFYFKCISLSFKKLIYFYFIRQN